MKNLAHEIILTLFKSHYVSNSGTSLNDLFKKFKIGNSEKIKIDRIKEILKILEEKKYLTWDISFILKDSNELKDESFKKDFITGNGRFDNLNNFQITGMLTSDGVDYAIDIDRKRIKQGLNILAITFAGLTVLLTGISLYKTIISQQELDKQQQNLQMQSKVVDSTLKVHQNCLNYLIQGRKGDSINSSLPR